MVDPSAIELQELRTLQQALDWVGLSDTDTRSTKTSLWNILGNPALVRHLVCIPWASWEKAITEWQVATTEGEVRTLGAPTPVELGQAGTLRRVCRLMVGLDPNEGAPMTVPPPAVIAPGALVPADVQAQLLRSSQSTIAERKVKLSTTMDQGDETEVKPMDPVVLRGLVAEWRELENDGEDPLEEEEATGDQLAALEFRLKEGSTPFVDFAVWRPFGARFGRMVKFLAYVQAPNGGLTTKEINGPASHEEWVKSWRVFSFAMTVLKAASRSRLEKYSLKIAKLNELYPNHWWIIGLADIRMRSEHLERIRRNLARNHAALPAGHIPPRGSFDPSKPWDLAFREAARDEQFWTEHVDRRALLFAAQMQSSSQILDEGVGPVSVLDPFSKTSTAAAAPSRKRKETSESDEPFVRKSKKKMKKQPRNSGSRKSGTAAQVRTGAPKPGGNINNKAGTKNADGRFYRDESGKQICWTWNHSEDGCSEVCPTGRVHVCEWCRKPGHRSISCRTRPEGWKP